jgi:hypothetical protein
LSVQLHWDFSTHIADDLRNAAAKIRERTVSRLIDNEPEFQVWRDTLNMGNSATGSKASVG